MYDADVIGARRHSQISCCGCCCIGEEDDALISEWSCS